MKKIITLLVLFPLIGIGGYAQKTLIGVNTGNTGLTPPYYGNITQYDINGENPAIVYEFDGIDGSTPVGKLFLASNGKLYGTAKEGGIPGAGSSNASGGVLFEYDLIFNKYSVLHYFDLNSIDEGYNPYIGVIEPTPGILIGATANRIFRYDFVTQNITFSNFIPINNIYDELMIASNGFIYGTSWGGNCSSTIANEPAQGTIFRYNLATNLTTTLFTYSCSGNNGTAPTKLVEISPGILLGTNLSGGIHTMTNPFLRGGTIFQFNLNTNVFTTKIDFDYSLHGVYPLNLVQGDNGKLYGLCQEGGIPPGNTSTNPTDFRGTLYEYIPATSVLEVKQYFGLNSFNSPTNLNNYVSYPTSLMRTSLGAFVGTIPSGGLFRWSSDTNTITIPNYTSSNINLYNAANLIEICRKPAYQEIIVTNFDSCIGGTFTYDIQNTNATSYQWLKNNVAVTGQTTGVLNLTNLTASDAGAYTCVMTNECGTTNTMALNLTVNCLGTNTVAQLDKAIKLYPNPTKNSLNIQLPENIEVNVTGVTIANSLGQIVLEQKTQGVTTLDVSHLQSGIYFINLTTNYGDWKGKFVKE
ncbi:T9SS type A sorting domain-containing protein [Flavobacterium sp.]|jgi:hypothetical protein|uniref:T9SS type A sorting domain-containing protein n=1 Tax=Flavobacterium sp. TaxID=239 RepID=UPI0037C08216